MGTAGDFDGAHHKAQENNFWGEICFIGEKFGGLVS